MIIPSIDLMGGQAVQLIGGREKALDAGDPVPLAKRFGLCGEIAVVDLDAALGTGGNADAILELIKIAECRVGGGIRDVETAVKWLDAGAAKIVLGTAAVPDVLKRLPRDRVIAALDAEHGEVVVQGWRKKTGERIADRMRALRELVSGFLVTFVEREGRMQGTALDQVARLVEIAHPAKVTIAGGITTPEEIAELDRLGADAQIGMALYSGRLDLADALAAPLRSDRSDGLWPTIVADEHGSVLGLVYSSRESLREALRTGRGVYQSRTRGLWVKGESSGAVQDLIRVKLDCDRDALLFEVCQHPPGFCHLGTRTCFGNERGLARLEKTLRQRLDSAPAGSYTARLLNDPWLLREKLLEEAGELADADAPDQVVQEAADLLYFAVTAMVRRGVSLADVAAELDRRALRVSRRPGDAKTERQEKPGEKP